MIYTDNSANKTKKLYGQTVFYACKMFALINWTQPCTCESR